MRRRLEPVLGTDLGAVRLHDGRPADELAGSLDAEAFTVGSDVPIPTEPPASTIVMMALFAAVSSLPSAFLVLPMWSFHPEPSPKRR